MLRALELIRQLQALDTEIDADRARISTIEATLTNRSEYESARRDHAEKSQAQRAADGEQKDLELQIGNARQHLAESEQKLYGGRIGNPRELDDLQKSSQALRRQIAGLEEKMLAAMEALDTASTAAKEADAKLRQIVTQRRGLETDLMGERKTLAAKARGLIVERDKLRGELDARTLRTYDRLRERGGGLAVAEVKQRTCQGCRVTMNVGQEQRIRQGESLVTCDSCGRILYLTV